MKLIKEALILYDDQIECLDLEEIIHQYFPGIIIQKEMIDSLEENVSLNLSEFTIVFFNSKTVIENHLNLALNLAKLNVPVVFIMAAENLKIRWLKIRKSITYLFKPYQVQHLINIIKDIEKEMNKRTKKTRLGTASSVLMSNGTTLPISKNKRKEFINRLNVL